MVAVGRALMSQPRILMMDEPSLGLAPIVIQEIFKVVLRAQEARPDHPPGRAERASTAWRSPTTPTSSRPASWRWRAPARSCSRTPSPRLPTWAWRYRRSLRLMTRGYPRSAPPGLTSCGGRPASLAGRPPTTTGTKGLSFPKRTDGEVENDATGPVHPSLHPQLGSRRAAADAATRSALRRRGHPRRDSRRAACRQAA